MKSTIRPKIFSLSAIILILFLLPVTAFAEKVGYFSRVEGRVDILKEGAASTVLVKINYPVYIGDMVRTKSDGKVEITFKDDTTVRIAPESRLKIDEYVFNPDNSRNKGALGLFRGKVRAVVSKTKGIIPVAIGASTFSVNTPTAIAGVKGTDLFVFHDRGITGVIFKEGSGFVQNPNIPEQIVHVNAGQVTFVTSPEVAPLPPRPATNVELIMHTKDTTPAEKPKEEKAKEEPSKTVVAKAEEKPADKEAKAEEGVKEEKPAEGGPAGEPEVEGKPVEGGEPTTEVTAAEGGEPAAAEAPASPEVVAAPEAMPVEMAGAEPSIMLAGADITPAAGGETFGYTPPTDIIPTMTPVTTDTTAFTLPITETELEDLVTETETTTTTDTGTGTTTTDTGTTTTDTGTTTTDTGTGTTTPPAETPPADTTAPVISISPVSASPVSGDIADVSISISSNESATYSYSLDSGSWTSTGSPLNLTGLSEGVPYTIDVKATDSAGNTSSTSSLSFTLSRYSLSGGFWGCIGGVTGTVTGEVAGVSGELWGGWSINMSGSGSTPPNLSWTLHAGGTSSDTTYANGINNGYWFESVTGTSDTSAQTLSGISSLKYLSYDRLGSGTGSLAGTYSGTSYTLTDTGTGTYTETPLSWSGKIDLSEIYNNEEWWYGSLWYNAVGWLDSYDELTVGIMGGTTVPWSGTPSVTYIGKDDGGLNTGNESPYIWVPKIYSWNVNDSTYTTYDGGTFRGFIGGVWRDNNLVSGEYDYVVDARAYSLYIDPDSNAGILKGSLSGTYNPYLTSVGSMFSLEGEWTPTQLATGLTFDPSEGIGVGTGSGITYHIYDQFTTLPPDFINYPTGSFTAGGGSMESDDRYGLVYSITGQDWGILQMINGGTYSGITSDSWTLSWFDIDDDSASMGYGTTGNLIGIYIEGTLWSTTNNTLEGNAYGYGADINAATPFTWISVGETIGTFDPATSTWQAVQTGAWLETSKFLTMAGCGSDPCDTTDLVTNPNANPTALTALNIPFVEVGRATLSGTEVDWNVNNPNLTAVNMNNVIFFAYNSGVAPKIWATGSVSGSYSADPVLDTAITLSGSGLTANFTPKVWDTTVNNKWIATVNGGGALSGGSYSGSVNIEGAAAGTNSGLAGTGCTVGTDCTFSGTGAGVAK